MFLTRLAASSDVAAEFRALEPAFVHYRLLRGMAGAAIARWRSSSPH